MLGNNSCHYLAFQRPPSWSHLSVVPYCRLFRSCRSYCRSPHIYSSATHCQNQNRTWDLYQNLKKPKLHKGGVSFLSIVIKCGVESRVVTHRICVRHQNVHLLDCVSKGCCQQESNILNPLLTTEIIW